MYVFPHNLDVQSQAKANIVTASKGFIDWMVRAKPTMCICFDLTTKQFNEEHPDQAFPKVLLAIIRLERQANEDYESIKDGVNQVDEMLKILDKCTNTHVESDKYADHLFDRAHKLSEHFKTYETIIDKVAIGYRVRKQFDLLSQQFTLYLHAKLEFKTLWIDGMRTIKTSTEDIKASQSVFESLAIKATKAYQTNQFFDLSSIRKEYNIELLLINNYMNQCFEVSKKCKHYGTNLYEQLSELEDSFQKVVRLSMERINEMKKKIN